MTIQHLAVTSLPTRHGVFQVHAFRESATQMEHIALVYGAPQDQSLVRLHSECLTGDVFGSRRCDCGAQLDMALQRIVAEGVGMLIYLRGHEGRGIGLGNKVRAYALQDHGADTVDANLNLGFAIDLRRYDAAIAMLRHFGVVSLRLLTNNQQKIAALQEAGFQVEHAPLLVCPNPDNARYLATKRERMGHMMEMRSVET